MKVRIKYNVQDRELDVTGTFLGLYKGVIVFKNYKPSTDNTLPTIPIGMVDTQYINEMEFIIHDVIIPVKCDWSKEELTEMYNQAKDYILNNLTD